MVRKYILENYPNCIRKKGCSKDALDLPYSYTSPCAKGLFDDLFYWDTYFINLGLLHDGLVDVAYNNIKDMAYLIEKFSYMPNAANYALINRSQVPLFIQMCFDYYQSTKDISFVRAMYSVMEKEYHFWTERRSFENGLCQYGNCADDKFHAFFYDEYKGRVKHIENKEFSKEEVGDNAMAECESGWDFSSRFDQRCLSFAPVDLNSILYANEKTLAFFSSLLSIENDYEQRAERRKQLINKYLHCQKGYFDYDVKNDKIKVFYTIASLLPYAYGISSDKEECRRVLSHLETEKGILTSEKVETECIYQWGYPNMWPNLVYFAFKALDSLSLVEEAKRISMKYTKAVEDEFNRCGKLWEKYDAVSGEKAKVNEYSETEMMGWTAGVYVVLDDYLKGVRK